MIRPDTLVDAVDQFLAAPPREACLLLVSPDPARLGRAAGDLAARYGWPVWRVGETLSAALLDVAPRDRPAAAARWFRDAADARASGPVLLVDVALLFEPALALNPLGLLREAARRTALVVAWPGAVAGDRLTYAVPEHAHYRAWPASDLCPTCIISL